MVKTIPVIHNNRGSQDTGFHLRRLLCLLVVAAIAGMLVLTLAFGASSSTSAHTPTAAPAPSPIQLIMDTSGPPFDHVAAIEGTFGVIDPFPIVNITSWINHGLDRNSRINIFVTDLELGPGEIASDVRVNLLDSQNQSFEVGAEAVRPIPGLNFTQVVFRLPDNVATGKCNLTVRWRGQVTNSGFVRIRPPKPTVEIRPIQHTIYVPDNCPRTFVIKNIGPEGSTLDYAVVDPNGWLERQNAVGSLAAGVSETISVRVYPHLLGDLDLLPTQTFIVVETPDATNYISFPVGFKIRNVSQIAEALLGTWSGTWSGTSQGRDNPGQTTPTTPVSGTWTLDLQAVDIANNIAAGTLTWNGTDAYWTYVVNANGTVTATPHPFTPNRTFVFNGLNARLDYTGFGNCNNGHRFHLIITGPMGPSDPYGPWFSIELNVESGAATTTGNGFNANPYNAANGDLALSHGMVTGVKTP
jgi:hypothetical protein